MVRLVIAAADLVEGAVKEGITLRLDGPDSGGPDPEDDSSAGDSTEEGGNSPDGDAGDGTGEGQSDIGEDAARASEDTADKDTDDAMDDGDASTDEGAGGTISHDGANSTDRDPAVGTVEDPAVGTVGPAVGTVEEPAVGTVEEPAVGTDKDPAGSEKDSTAPEKDPTVGTDEDPSAMFAFSLPELPPPPPSRKTEDVRPLMTPAEPPAATTLTAGAAVAAVVAAAAEFAATAGSTRSAPQGSSTVPRGFDIAAPAFLRGKATPAFVSVTAAAPAAGADATDVAFGSLAFGRALFRGLFGGLSPVPGLTSCACGNRCPSPSARPKGEIAFSRGKEEMVVVVFGEGFVVVMGTVYAPTTAVVESASESESAGVDAVDTSAPAAAVTVAGEVVGTSNATSGRPSPATADAATPPRAAAAAVRESTIADDGDSSAAFTADGATPSEGRIC